MRLIPGFSSEAELAAGNEEVSEPTAGLCVLPSSASGPDPRLPTLSFAASECFSGIHENLPRKRPLI